MPHVKKEPAIRKAELLAAAIHVAREVGYNNVTRSAIAQRAGVSDASVSAHWGTMIQVKRAIMREAVRLGDAKIVAQGLSVGDGQALKAPPELRTKAAISLATA